jgi:cell division septation protein DedD
LAQDDYYYEIQLTNKQLVFYFMAGATGLILSFLAGVMVGRGVDAQAGDVQAARGAQEERTIVEETPRPVSPAPSPAELSYAQRLESDKLDDSLAKPPATLTPVPTASTKGASPKPSAAPTMSSTPPAGPPSTAATRESKVPKAPKATPEPPAAEGHSNPTPAPATTRTAAREPREGQEAKAPKAAPTAGAFAIQVGAFKDRATADTVVSRLKGKGFAAFVVPPEGSDGLFLVRVGSFGARADAERTEARLRDQEKFKPYIVKN